MKKPIFGDLLDRLSAADSPDDKKPAAKTIVSEAKIQAKEIILAAKEEVLKVKEEIERKKKAVEKKLAELEELKEEEVAKLEKVAKLSTKEAKEALLAKLEEKLSKEIAVRIKEAEERAEEEAEKKARYIIADAIQRAASDYVAEYTTSSIKLKDEEIKGRIIGKEGRNIRAFERATGVDVELEEAGEIILSSFDSIRRAIAKRAMERLIADGRIQPVRIEGIVRRTRADFQREIRSVGRQLCLQTGVSNLSEKIVDLLGRYKYRTSYGQSLYQHTLEVVNLGKLIAAEIGAEVEVVKLACLLHDIGKVLPADLEGSHTKIGVDFLRRHGIGEMVLKAIAGHHEEVPIETLEQIAVYVADAISGARPGARYEPLEEYIKRIGELERIAKAQEGVADAYAIEAGREVRVIVRPEKITDNQMQKLAFEIASEIHQKVASPGQVKITVIRETREEAIAGQEGGEAGDKASAD